MTGQEFGLVVLTFFAAFGVLSITTAIAVFLLWAGLRSEPSDGRVKAWRETDQAPQRARGPLGTPNAPSKTTGDLVRSDAGTADTSLRKVPPSA